MIPMLIEAALRSLLLALAVWAGLRAFRVRNVLAQKSAWGLVLALALLMPILAPFAARPIQHFLRVRVGVTQIGLNDETVKRRILRFNFVR